MPRITTIDVMDNIKTQTRALKCSFLPQILSYLQERLGELKFPKNRIGLFLEKLSFKNHQSIPKFDIEEYPLAFIYRGQVNLLKTAFKKGQNLEKIALIVNDAVQRFGKRTTVTSLSIQKFVTPNSIEMLDIKKNTLAEFNENDIISAALLKISHTQLYTMMDTDIFLFNFRKFMKFFKLEKSIRKVIQGTFLLQQVEEFEYFDYRFKKHDISRNNYIQKQGSPILPKIKVLLSGDVSVSHRLSLPEIIDNRHLFNNRGEWLLFKSFYISKKPYKDIQIATVGQSEIIGFDDFEDRNHVFSYQAASVKVQYFSMNTKSAFYRMPQAHKTIGKNWRQKKLKWLERIREAKEKWIQELLIPVRVSEHYLKTQKTIPNIKIFQKRLFEVTNSYHTIKHIPPMYRPIKLLPGISSKNITPKNIFFMDGHTRNALLKQKFNPEIYAKNMEELASRKVTEPDALNSLNNSKVMEEKRCERFGLSGGKHVHRRTKSQSVEMKPKVKKTYSKLHKLLESYYNSNSITKIAMAQNQSNITGCRVMSLGNNSLMNSSSKSYCENQVKKVKRKQKFLNHSVSKVYLKK